MNRAETLREVRMERFEEVYELWRGRRITQAWAASVLGVTDRTFRRWVVRYEAGGAVAVEDKRVRRPSHRRASAEEVAALEATGTDTKAGRCGTSTTRSMWRKDGGERSYTWVKNRLQEAGLVKRGAGGGRIGWSGSGSRRRG